MNTWITERVLEIEIDRLTRARDEFVHALLRERRTNGWISAYKLKTKRFSSAVVVDEVELCNALEAGEECNQSNNTHTVNEEEEHLCTICLLALEEGDRVADVKCKHWYHADCLSEWILKKVSNITQVWLPLQNSSSGLLILSDLASIQNSCPLCQTSGIAEEVRSFDRGGIVHSSISEENDNSESFTARWRRRIEESFIDIATGRGARHRRRNELLQWKLGRFKV
jgi:hypothetical protein